MRLVQELERLLLAEESPFRKQLLREDIARLRRLQAIAPTTPDLSAFVAAGRRIGWTHQDTRTHELHEPLTQLLEAVYAFERGQRDAAQEARIVQAWRDLHRLRLERLLGCLSTPVPRPAD